MTNICENKWRVLCIAAVGAVLASGCATRQTLPPLFTSAPRHAAPGELELLEVPVVPELEKVPLVLRIPQQKAEVDAENHIMGRDAVIKPGSSVVISVPNALNQKSEEKDGKTAKGNEEDKASGNFEFQTDGYFNVMEQCIERGLISIGLNVKDRSKFEAKLRDMRDSGTADSYAIALADLQKELNAGRLTLDQFTEQSKQLQERLLDSKGKSQEDRKEMKDISEVIRAAQDGSVMADYILQVNAAAVEPYRGMPLQLGLFPETQKLLRDNPGLRLGAAGEKGCIPSSIPRQWAQARFNAKLIDVKTGSIDWIGEYRIDSLAVLKEGIQIGINVRKRTANAKSITGAIEDYNRALEIAHRRALADERELDSAYDAAMEPVDYRPINPPCILPIFPQSTEEGDSRQAARREKVDRCESSYEFSLAAYRDLVRDAPEEANMDWAYDYDVDQPIVIPDLLRPRTEEDARNLEEHVKALGLKVTRDLLATIKISEDGNNP